MDGPYVALRGPCCARPPQGDGSDWVKPIIVARRRMPAAAPTAGRARLMVAGLFEPRRARPRIVAALPCRPGWRPSPDATAQTVWRLRSGLRRIPPLPAATA